MEVKEISYISLIEHLYIEISSIPSFSALGYTECFKKSINISFQLIPPEKQNEEFFLKWIKKKYKATHGGFFICDTHFDESCFEGDLKKKVLVLSF